MRNWLRAVKDCARLAEKIVHVECYAGYKGDERPLKLQIGNDMVDVADVEDRWYSPGATYFRVLANDGNYYVLRHDEGQDSWTLDGYRQARLV